MMSLPFKTTQQGERVSNIVAATKLPAAPPNKPRFLNRALPSTPAQSVCNVLAAAEGKEHDLLGINASFSSPPPTPASEEGHAEGILDDEHYAQIGGGADEDEPVYSLVSPSGGAGSAGVGNGEGGVNEDAYARLPSHSSAIGGGGYEEVYARLSRTAVGGADARIGDPDSTYSAPADSMGVAPDYWKNVPLSPTRRNGIRAGSRGSWSTVGSRDGASLIELMERMQTTSKRTVMSDNVFVD
jgi:hypothetical protein